MLTQSEESSGSNPSSYEHRHDEYFTAKCRRFLNKETLLTIQNLQKFLQEKKKIECCVAFKVKVREKNKAILLL